MGGRGVKSHFRMLCIEQLVNPFFFVEKKVDY